MARRRRRNPGLSLPMLLVLGGLGYLLWQRYQAARAAEVMKAVRRIPVF